MWEDSIQGSHEELVSLIRNGRQPKHDTDAKYTFQSNLSRQRSEDTDTFQHSPQATAQSRFNGEQTTILSPEEEIASEAMLSRTNSINDDYNLNYALLSSPTGEVPAEPSVRIDEFKDIQSRARFHWRSGVKVELGEEKKQQAKKKAWLNENDWFGTTNTKSQSVDRTQFDEQSIEPGVPVMVGDIAEPIKNMAWSDVVAGGSRRDIHMAANVTSPQPTIKATMTPNPILPYTDTYKFQSPARHCHPDDDRLNYQFLYGVERKLYGAQTLPKFQSESDRLLQNATVHSHRTFSKLVSALLVVLAQEQYVNNWTTFDVLVSKLSQFICAANVYIQYYVHTPAELLPLLRLFLLLACCHPESAPMVPIPMLRNVLEKNKHTFFPAELEKAEELIRSIPVHLSVESLANHTGWDAPDTTQEFMQDSLEKQNQDEEEHEYANPSVAAILLQELLDNRLKANNELSLVANKVDTPWPTSGFLNYLRTHYVLLREELFGSARIMFEKLFKGAIIPTVQNDVAFYSNLSILATTLSPAKYELILLMRVNQASENSLHSSLEIQQGSLAILSENNSQPGTTACFIGTVVARVWHKKRDYTIRDEPTCIFAIHLQDNVLHRLDYTASYSLIITPPQVSTVLPVLGWLRDQAAQAAETTHSDILVSRILSVTNTIEIPHEQSQALNDHRTNVSNSETPEYLMKCELDVSSVMVSDQRGCRAQPGLNIWPTLQDKYFVLPPSQRPQLYSLSESQVEAIQYALCHRIAVISGRHGTGKTHIASKMVELIHQALVNGQCFHPLLVLAKNESTLDIILNNVLKAIPDIVRYGSDTKHQQLSQRQCVKLAMKTGKESLRKAYDVVERRFFNTQRNISALWYLRQQIVSGEAFIMATTIPAQCADAMRLGYGGTKGSSFHEFSLERIWTAWMGSANRNNMEFKTPHDKSIPDIIRTFASYASHHIQSIVDPESAYYRAALFDSQRTEILNLYEARNWPLPTSEDCSQVRKELEYVWCKVPSSSLWNMPQSDKHQLVYQIKCILLQHVDLTIRQEISKQQKECEQMDHLRLQIWAAVSQFGRVIATTADFAAEYQDLFHFLSPRAMIVDDASSIHESTLASLAMSPRMEHLILIGDQTSVQRPKVTNEDLTKEPYRLDVSLFERWILSGGDVKMLKEQWRLSENMATLLQQTCPTPCTSDITMMNTSRVNIRGLLFSTFFVDYQSKLSQNEVDIEVSRALGTRVTGIHVDEARFICCFAIYLYQQGYKIEEVAILTICPTQRQLVTFLMTKLIETRICLPVKMDKIIIDSVSNFAGRECAIALISLTTPGKMTLKDAILPLALSRARQGLYIVGDCTGLSPGWKKVAQYMDKNGHCSTRISLQCQRHQNSTSYVGHWCDFEKVKNGGCLKLCNTLMDCGHVCVDTCHHWDHSQTKCMEPCQRPRPDDCTHPCQNKCYQCFKGCPPCKKPRNFKLLCGHSVIRSCNSELKPEEYICTESVIVNLECGHVADIECHLSRQVDVSFGPCKEEITKILSCGHATKALCGSTPICSEKCESSLVCGHGCFFKCGEIHSHSRSHCQAPCTKQLICGHYCAKVNPMITLTDALNSADMYVRMDTSADESVGAFAIHAGTLVHPRVSMENARKNATRHTCSGLCGETCPPCRKCKPSLQCPITLKTLEEFDEKDKLYMLPECQCVFSVEALDLYFENQAKSGKHTTIKLWQCPSCQVPIYTALRYRKYIKTEISLVNEIKAKQEEARQLVTQGEKSDIIEAMNAEARKSVYNIVGGRWFVCENNHPYYIGECGGATETSNCPQCGAVIGGENHKVVDSNRFFGEFDGSDNPAWPSQPGSNDNVMQ